MIMRIDGVKPRTIVLFTKVNIVVTESSLHFPINIHLCAGFIRAFAFIAGY